MSSCLFCHYGIPLLDLRIGTRGDPVGLCVACNSLCCGWHGARTTSSGFLCLVCDYTDLFASAGWDAFKRAGGLNPIEAAGGPAAAHGDSDAQPGAGGEREAAADLAWALGALFSTASGEPSPLVVATLAQWLEQRPSYKRLEPELTDAVAWAIGVINRYFRSKQEINEFLQSRQDYQAEGYIRGTYDPRSVHAMWKSLSEDGRRLLAAAVLLVIAFELPREMLPLPVVSVVRDLGEVLNEYRAEVTALRERITGNEQQ